jgi:hypothetical protein
MRKRNLITTDEYALIAGVHVNTVRKWAAKGKLPGARRANRPIYGNKMWMVPADAPVPVGYHAPTTRDNPAAESTTEAVATLDRQFPDLRGVSFREAT